MDTRLTYICQTVQNNKSKIVIWGALLLLAFVWGSSFILMKIAIFDSSGEIVYTPLEVAALRIAIAGIVLLPITIKYLNSIKRSQILPLFAIGTLGNLFPAYLFTSAVSSIPSAIVGMLNALTPLFTMIVAAFVFKTVVSPGDPEIHDIFQKAMSNIEGAKKPRGNKWLVHFIHTWKFDVEDFIGADENEVMKVLDKEWDKVQEIVTKVETELLKYKTELQLHLE